MGAWEGLGVPRELQRSLSEQGFTSPTPIQTLSLPPAIFHHRDIIGAAETVSLALVIVFVLLVFHFRRREENRRREEILGEEK